MLTLNEEKRTDLLILSAPEPSLLRRGGGEYAAGSYQQFGINFPALQPLKLQQKGFTRHCQLVRY